MQSAHRTSPEAVGELDQTGTDEKTVEEALQGCSPHSASGLAAYCSSSGMHWHDIPNLVLNSRLIHATENTFFNKFSSLYDMHTT